MPIARTLIIASIALTVSVYLLGALSIDVMEVDAAQYASISREMMESGSYLEVHHRTLDYLDKPPLLFWLSAVSMSLFGASGFAYRIPSLIAALIGAYATGRLGARLYGPATGWIAALMLMTTQAMFLMAHDIRTDTMLTGAVALAVWQLKVFIDERRPSSFLIGLAGIAAAMLTKGPIGLMIPVLALASDALWRKDWKAILDWRWAAGGVLVLLALAPMLWGLYRQFGAEGLRFYFWTQSFGRITGENPWKDQSTVLFFTHTFLWAFMPWMAVATYAVAKRLVALIRRRLPSSSEVLTLGAFVLPFVALSFSQYKLPHYIFPLFPFAAILAAQELWSLITTAAAQKSRRVVLALQSAITLLLWAAAATLALVVFPLTDVLVIAIFLALGAGTVLFSLPRRPWATRLLMPSVVTMIAANLLLNGHVYPRLLEFQAGSAAAHFVRREGIPVQRLAFHREVAHSMEFYTGTIIPPLDPDTSRVPAEGLWVFTNDAGRAELAAQSLAIDSVVEFPDFHVTRLNARFLNPRTREQTLSRRYLLHVLPSGAGP